ncbi:MAG: hypothetical protein KKF56_05755 [Nanoarchaeota archaeon]|nr:hypothetical protein [Nanoarchaeota archaeon]
MSNNGQRPPCTSPQNRCYHSAECPDLLRYHITCRLFPSNGNGNGKLPRPPLYCETNPEVLQSTLTHAIVNELGIKEETLRPKSVLPTDICH